MRHRCRLLLLCRRRLIVRHRNRLTNVILLWYWSKKKRINSTTVTPCYIISYLTVVLNSNICQLIDDMASYGKISMRCLVKISNSFNVDWSIEKLRLLCVHIFLKLKNISWTNQNMSIFEAEIYYDSLPIKCIAKFSSRSYHQIATFFILKFFLTLKYISIKSNYGTFISAGRCDIFFFIKCTVWISSSFSFYVDVKCET